MMGETRKALAVFDEAGTPLTTAEVAERLGLDSERARTRLDALLQVGHVDSRTVGDDTRLWWLVAPTEGGRARDRAQASIGRTARPAALDDLDRTVREITEAIVDRSTRDEIEAAVCQRLADAESYGFAWIGTVDVATRTVEPRVVAGIDGSLDGVAVTVDPDDERSVGPTSRACRTGEVEFVRAVDDDPHRDRVGDGSEGDSYRSSAAVPILHDGAVYGVLSVYTDRPDAFDERECAVLGHLGTLVGHAIACVEYRRALMNDELVEVEFLIPDVIAPYDLPSADGAITLEKTVPVGGGEYIMYGATDETGLAVIEGLVDRLSHWEEVSVVEQRYDGTEFQVRLTEPPVLTAIASHGGYIEEAAIDGNHYRITTHLPPSVDVRRVLDVIEQDFPAVEMLTHRQISRTENRLDDGFGELTDRQRSILEAAYFAGYFEWPRESTGEEVAEMFDISAPTFHQHLRQAEKTVLGRLLNSSV